MKKLFAAAIVMGFFASACVVVDDACECYYGDPPMCLNSIDLAYGCSDDCNWDVIEDCDASCYLAGYSGGECIDGGGFYDDDCSCY